MEEAQLNFMIKGLESRLECFLPNYHYSKQSIKPNNIKSYTEDIIKKYNGVVPIKVQQVLNCYNDIDMIGNLEMVDKFIKEITEAFTKS